MIVLVDKKVVAGVAIVAVGTAALLLTRKAEAPPVEPPPGFSTFTFSVIEQTSGPGIWKGGIIEIDGVQYTVPPGEPSSIQLAAGSHTIQATIPSGYKFIIWSPTGGVVVGDVFANPTGFTTSGDAAMFAWIGLVAPSLFTPPSGFTQLIEVYRGCEIWCDPTQPRYWCKPTEGYVAYEYAVQGCRDYIDWVLSLPP